MDGFYGLLMSKNDMLVHRTYFDEMCKLIGVKIEHRAPRPGKSYTNYAEIQSNYYEPEVIGCIFDEHPNQKTMRKLGWNSELFESAVIISVPYDTQGLQKGSLFTLPSAFDNTPGRLFRVTELSSIMIYPCSITCQAVPEFENTFSDSLYSHKTNSFNLLNRED